MNRSATEQPVKKLSRTKMLLKMGMVYQAGQLLTNGGVAPIPHHLPNQRQKRKLAAQTR